MPLETGEFISDLVITNPLGTDPKAQGDDHLRLLKKTLQQSFPNIDQEVSATGAEMDSWEQRILDLEGNPIASQALVTGANNFQLDADVRKIRVLVENFSVTDQSQAVRFRMTVAGSPDNTARYEAAAFRLQDAAAVVGSTQSTHFGIELRTSAAEYSGIADLELIDPANNIWAFTLHWARALQTFDDMSISTGIWRGGATKADGFSISAGSDIDNGDVSDKWWK